MCGSVSSLGRPLTCGQPARLQLLFLPTILRAPQDIVYLLQTRSFFRDFAMITRDVRATIEPGRVTTLFSSLDSALSTRTPQTHFWPSFRAFFFGRIRARTVDTNVATLPSYALP